MGETFNSSLSIPFKLAQTEILICRYVDGDSQRGSYKNMLQTYAVKLHKRAPAGTFPHKFNWFSFHYTTNCTALFSVTEQQKSITGCLNSSIILWYIAARILKHWNILNV